MSATDAEQASVISHNSSAELRNIALEVYKVLTLLESDNIVKVNILVAPFEIVNYSFVSQLFFDNENILKEFNDPLTNVQMVEFCDHCFLILQILFILVN